MENAEQLLVSTEANIQQAVEECFDRLRATGAWDGDGKRIAGGITRYAVGMMRRSGKWARQPQQI